MRYVFSEPGDTKRTKEILQALRHKGFSGERFRFHNESIFIISTKAEDVRQRCRAFCLGYVVAKGWR